MDLILRYGMPEIGIVVRKLGMEWYHTPIPDVDVPGAAFEALWPDVGMRLHHHLTTGRKVLLHCRGGLGRTGMIAARLLAELGMSAADAVRAVRTAREGAIETAEQKNHVLSIRAVPVPQTGEIRQR